MEKKVAAYLDAAGKRAENKFGNHALDFNAVTLAAKHFQDAGTKILAKQKNPPRALARLNQALRSASVRCWFQRGLRHRPWFRHASTLQGIHGVRRGGDSGVNEALDKGDAERARQQLAVLAAALERRRRCWKVTAKLRID